MLLQLETSLNMEILLSDVTNIGVALGVFIIAVVLLRFDKKNNEKT